jgi:hypothetical protein
MSLIVAGPTHSYRRWTVAGQVETKLDASDTKPAWSVPTHHGCARCPSHGLPDMKVELVAHSGGGMAPAFKPPRMPFQLNTIPAGCVDTPVSSLTGGLPPAKWALLRPS